MLIDSSGVGVGRTTRYGMRQIEQLGEKKIQFRRYPRIGIGEQAGLITGVKLYTVCRDSGKEDSECIWVQI